MQVTSRKDQEQYWADHTKQYKYVSVGEFANRFKQFHVGMRLDNELSIPFDRRRNHSAALVFTKYSVPIMELLRTCFDKELLLIKKNAFVYIFKTVQLVFVAAIVSTVFIRSRLHVELNDGMLYIGALIFSMVINMFNGFAELSMAINRLPVFYKQRDLRFHPAWTFTLPNFLLTIPMSMIETVVWMIITYYSIGFAPEASRQAARTSFAEPLNFSDR